MAPRQGLTSLRSLAQSPLPLWALALLFGQALGGWHGEISALLAALAAAAGLCVAARHWRAAVAIALALLGHQQVSEVLRPPQEAGHVVVLAPGHAFLRALVVERNEREEGKLQLLLRADALRRGDGWQPVTGLVLLTLAEARQAWQPGMRIAADLRLKRPRNFGNPGEFDYEGYLARRGIYVTAFLLDDAAVAIVERPASGWVDAWRERVRAQLVALASPAREILAALILGEMGALPRHVRDDFAAAGVSHVLSISGLHVAMVAGGAYALFRWLLGRSRWLLLRARVPLLAAALSLGPVWLYAELAQAGVATWRALVMLVVVIGGALSGRRGNLPTNLAAAAIAVSLVSPGAVLDVSFQLSFVSVLALVLAMERYWAWWSPYREARLLHLRGGLYRWLGWGLATAVVNASALSATAPLTALHFNQVPLIGLIANPVVVPLLGTAAVALGLAGALACLWVPPLAALVFGLAAQVSFAGAWLAERMATLPGAGVRVVTPSPWELFLVYSAFAVALLDGGRRRRALLLLLFLLASADVGLELRQRYARSELRVTFLSVGQGDCTIVEFPGSEVMVVDGGGLRGFDVGERLVAPYLWRRKIARIDTLVLTHPDFDHYGGLAYLVRNFAPREFWHSGDTSEAATYAALRRALHDSGTRELAVRRDERREIGGCRVAVSWPVEGVEGPDNDRSVVLRLECGEASILLTGDLQAAGEASLLSLDAALRSDVLKAGHHGSHTSSSPRFLDAVRPRAAVVSAGYANRFGFPDARVLHALAGVGAGVFRTDLDGAVVLRARFDGSMEVETQRTRPMPERPLLAQESAAGPAVESAPSHERPGSLHGR